MSKCEECRVIVGHHKDCSQFKLSPKYFECMCHSPEHTLKFDIDEDLKTVAVTCYLDRHQPWYKRIVAATRFVFGFEPSKYGHFAETFLKDEGVKELIEL